MTSSSTSTIGVLPPDVVTLIPYSAARRLRAIAVAASPKEVTVLLPLTDAVDATLELRSLTGLHVAPIDTPAERIDSLLDRLTGSLETDDLWLQRRHIQALSRLVDHSVNMGQVDQVRSLVDRALEFAPYSAELWLMKARVSSQRSDVVRALTIATDIAPNDRRVLRWTQSLQDLQADETPETTLLASGSDRASGSDGDRAEKTGRIASDELPRPQPSTAPVDTGSAEMETQPSEEPAAGADSAPRYITKPGDGPWRARGPTQPMPATKALQANQPSPAEVAAEAIATPKSDEPAPEDVVDSSTRVYEPGEEQSLTSLGGSHADSAAGTARAEPPHGVGDVLLQSALELSKLRDLSTLLQRTGDIVMGLAAADSATVFLKSERSWVGWTNDTQLEPHLTRAVPKEDRLAAQVIRQGLPLAISDTASRVEDVGRLIYDAGVRSFALLPIRTHDDVGGLVYLNYRTPNRADVIFAPDLGRRIEVVLTCAGVAAAAIQQKDAMLHAAALDGLTGAYGLEQFERLLATEIDRARRYRYSVALLGLDLDDFARVNALHGRAAADHVLREFCSRVLGLGRSSDVLARQADDDFLLMLPQTTGKGAEILARRIHNAMEDPVVVDHIRISVSLSIGLASFPERADDAQGLINAAEIALYGAKAQGKHRTHVADTLSLGN